MVFKTLKMVREIRDKYYEDTKNFSIEEQIEFFKRKSEELQKELKDLQYVTIEANAK